MKSVTKWVRIVPILIGVISFFLLTCSTNEVEDPLSLSNFTVSENSALTNTAGLEKDTFHTYDTILLNLDGLIKLEQTHIEIVKGCPDCEYTIKRHVVPTDRHGKITNLPVWHHVGVDQEGNRVDEAGDYCLHITQPPKHEPWTVISICFKVVNELAPEAQIRPTDATGTFNGAAALVGEDVFARGDNFASGVDVRLYVIDNKDEYNPGDVYTDVTGGFENVTTAGDGSIANTQVWAGAAAVGSYDLVADLAPFGEYNDGDVVYDAFLTGLLVQQPPVTDDLVMDIAMDWTGTYKDVFDEIEPIFARVDPLTRPGDLASFMWPLAQWLPVYVVVHKDVWNEGDRLVAVATVGTLQMPCYVLVNPMSGSFSSTRIRGETKPAYWEPLKLWPGTYDLIVDVNRDRVYTPGVDLIDGGPQIGFTVVSETEVTPPVRLIDSADEDFIGRQFNQTRVWTHLVRPDNSPIVGVTVKYTVVLGPGQVDPAVCVTDEDGMCFTTFSGGEYGVMSRVRTECVVDGVLYYSPCSIFRLIPCSHNQGFNQGTIGGF